MGLYSLHTTSRIEADDEGGFRYLPHSVSASRPSRDGDRNQSNSPHHGGAGDEARKGNKSAHSNGNNNSGHRSDGRASHRRNAEKHRERETEESGSSLGGSFILAFPSGATINQNQLDRKTIAALVTAAIAVKEVIPIMMNTTGVRTRTTPLTATCLSMKQTIPCGVGTE